MGKTKKTSGDKVGLRDIVAFAKAGWTPSEVNAILDRMDSIGDITEPDPIDDIDNDEVDDEIIDPEDENTEESDEDEIDNDSDDDEKEDTTNQKKAISKSTVLESENTRLKKELAKLQAKNRSKDVSSDNTKSIESSLIDTFQSLFE